MLKGIKKLFLHFRLLIFKNWSVLTYNSVYEILKVGDAWIASVVLLIDSPPTGNPRKDRVLVVPLDISYPDPEQVFMYLQILGPIFYRTSQKVLVAENGIVIKEWDLTKTAKEQGMTVQLTDFIKAQKQSNVSIATNEGSLSIN